MSSINSLVGRAPTTFLSSSGPTNTWLDDYIDNPNYRPGSLLSNDKEIFYSSSRRPDLSNQGYRTLELRPGMDGFSGPPTLEKLPNYNPDNDPGLTLLSARQDSPDIHRPHEETAFLNFFGGGKPKQVDPNNPYGYVRDRTTLNNAIYSDQLGGNWNGEGTARDYIEWYQKHEKDNSSIYSRPEKQQMAGTNPKLLELVGELSV